MRPVMYIFINEGLRMSAGKVAAQASHAAVEAYRLSLDPEQMLFGKPRRFHTPLLDEWYKGGHYTKLVMSARSRDHLVDIDKYIRARGFKTALVIDEGHTEIPPITPTALGVEVVDKDDSHTAATFESFKLLKTPRPSDPSNELRERHTWVDSLRWRTQHLWNGGR